MYVAEIKYTCGHYRTACVRSAALSGVRHRDLKCPACRAKEQRVSEKYKGVPISAAKDISKRYAKDQVIVVTWDSVHGRTHITTYGKDKEQCRQAAMGGEKIADALGWNKRTTEPQEGA